MGPLKHPGETQAIHPPLWLEISVARTNRVFLVRAEDERAIVVGSLLRADVHLPQQGVAPVHFHFEREGDRIWLVPTYRAELRVNSARISEPCPIVDRATIEFLGLSLQAVVHEKDPGHGETRTGWRTGVLHGAQRGIDYLTDLPSETDPTGVALTSLDRAHPTSSTFDTVQVVSPRLELDELSVAGTESAGVREHRPDPLPPQNTERIFSPTFTSERLGPQGTLIMDRLRFGGVPHLDSSDRREPDGIPAIDTTNRAPIIARPILAVMQTERFVTPATVGSSTAPPEPTAPSPRIRRAPSSGTEPRQTTRIYAPTEETTQFEIPQPVAPTPARGVLMTASPPELERDVISARLPLEGPRCAEADADPSTPPPVERPVLRARFGQVPWVALLGMIAKRRPIPVAAGTLLSALVLALALVGTSRLLPGANRAERRASQHVRPTSEMGVTSTTATATAVPRPSAPEAASSPSPAPEVVRAPLEPTSGEGEKAPGFKKPAGPVGSELVQAVALLQAGRYHDAASAYAALATRSPENPSYAVLARLLEKRSAPACAENGATRESCPEVKP